MALVSEQCRKVVHSPCFSNFTANKIEVDASKVGVARVKAINEVQLIACSYDFTILLQLIVCNHAQAIVDSIGNESHAYERFRQLDGNSGCFACFAVFHLHVTESKDLSVGVEHGSDSAFRQPRQPFCAISAILHCVRDLSFAVVGVNHLSPAASLHVGHVVNEVGILAIFTVFTILAVFAISTILTISTVLAASDNIGLNAVDYPVTIFANSDNCAIGTVSTILSVFAIFTISAILTISTGRALGCLASVLSVDVPEAVADFDRWNIAVLAILAIGTILSGSTT